MTIGATIRKLRRRKALTQQQLATLSGTHQSTIARIETGGTTAGLTVLTLKRMAEALGCSIDLLAGRKGTGPAVGRPGPTLRSPRPLTNQELWAAIEPVLRHTTKGGDVCVLIEEYQEHGEYLTVIQRKEFRGAKLAKKRWDDLVPMVIEQALNTPLATHEQIEHQILSRGVRVSRCTVSNILRAQHLRTPLERARELSRKVGAGEIELSERQRSAVEALAPEQDEPNKGPIPMDLFSSAKTHHGETDA